MLPGSVKRIVGWLGFQHDRKLALRALAVSAEKSDVHAVFAGLSLMTYHGVVLLLSGYQADEQHILRQYRAIVDKYACVVFCAGCTDGRLDSPGGIQQARCGF